MKFPWSKKPDNDDWLDFDSLPLFGNQMFRLLDSDSKLVDAYYSVRRFVVKLSPRSLYREVKWFLQRGKRGWADCDTWSLDNYMSRWLPDALLYLKEHKQGIPSSMLNPEDCGEHGSASDEGMIRGEARWNAIMDQMIEGFKAYNRLADSLYEPELGEYPMDRPVGLSSDAWSRIKDTRSLASKKLEDRDTKLAEEGMLLMVKHWSSLWD